MAKARSKSRRRTPPRNAKGRFMKRGAAKRSRSHARRSKPVRRRAARRAVTSHARRAAPVRRRRHAHRRRGRFVSLRKVRYTPKYVARARKRRSKTGKHLRAVSGIGAGGRVAGLVRLNPREMMALTNPRRRRKRRALAVRPRRHHRRSVRRNPSMGGLVGVMKASVPMVVGGLGGGLASGLMDASVLAEQSLPVRLAVKGAAAVASEAFLRKKHPRLAAGLSGGLFGSVGYDMGLTMGGGMVAHNKRDAVKKVAYQALNDPEMAAMMGDMVDTEVLSDIASGEYDEHLADIVEA